MEGNPEALNLKEVSNPIALQLRSLQELDPLLAQQLGGLAARLWSLYGSLEDRVLGGFRA